MSSAIRARKSLALLAAAAVVAAGLALSPAIATPAHASTTSSTVAKLVKKINADRTREGQAKFLRNGFLDKFAAEAAKRLSQGKKGAAIYATKNQAPDGVVAGIGLPAGVYGGSSTASRIKYLVSLYGTKKNFLNEINNEDYNYAAAGFAVKGKEVYSVVILAGYDTPPLDLLTQSTPKITGSAKVGATLKVKTATSPSGATYTYSWRYGSTELGTGNTYVPVAADLGHKITLVTIASKDGYVTTTAKKSVAVKIAAGTLVTAKPVVTGTRTVGETLTATVAPWGPGTVALTYQWLRDGKPITTATESSYLLVAADKGKVINLKVIGREVGYKAASVTTGSKTKTKAAVVTPAP